MQLSSGFLHGEFLRGRRVGDLTFAEVRHAISLLLMLSLPWDTWLRLIVWLVLGLTLYLVYGRRRSRLRRA